MSAAVEDRLRTALAARADQVTVADLQPAARPSRRAVPERRRRGWNRPRWVPALAGLAVAAIAVVFVVFLAWRPQHPSLPADVPAPIPATSATPPPPPATASAAARPSAGQTRPASPAQPSNPARASPSRFRPGASPARVTERAVTAVPSGATSLACCVQVPPLRTNTYAAPACVAFLLSKSAPTIAVSPSIEIDPPRKLHSDASLATSFASWVA